MYDEQVAAFAARYRVIRYDVQGFGRSGPPSGPSTNYDALHDLLAYLGIERPAILGMSMGGGIAIDFALTYPTMVDALVLAAAGLDGYNGSAATRQQTEQQWRRSLRRWGGETCRRPAN
ncbi:MAG TPA: alpha/beta fold hydrolase [Chloroflexota bacterium]|nr:alpha/beta fold hydrolase [Chloroflexota bacterium]